jgi:hypothetical protein
MRVLYSNPTKSEKEQSFFDTFLSVKKDLPIEKWEKGESPDYILYISREKIGLELTTLVLNTPNKGIPLASIRAAQNNCLKKATELAKQNGLEPAEVQVKFRSDDDPIDVDIAAKELVEFLKKEIPKIDDSKSWHYYESGLKYSQWIIIHLGTVNGHKWLPHHRCIRIHMNWMLKDQSRIDVKQTKVSKYLQRCDKCWLLIGVDEGTAPEAVYITKETENHVFFGDFERLFFLLNFEGRVAELKITHRETENKS